jgi:hypothetical protein
MMNNETDTANDTDTKMQMHNRLTQAQLEAIEHEIKSTQPLTSYLLPIDVLLRQYSYPSNDGISTGDNYSCDSSGDGFRAVAQHPGYAEAAAFLSTKYKFLRRVRGDGNCYYRAFLYSLCEHLLRSCCFKRDNHRAEFIRLKEVVNNSLKWVCRYGYEEYTIDMFWEELVELFNFIEVASNTVSEERDDDDGGGGPKRETTCNTRFDNALQQLHSKLNEENAVSAFTGRLPHPTNFFLTNNFFPASFITRPRIIALGSCVSWQRHK